MHTHIHMWIINELNEIFLHNNKDADEHIGSGSKQTELKAILNHNTVTLINNWVANIQ